MRLAELEIAAIKAAARETLGGGAAARLFGRRADDCERGGEIDLRVEADRPADEWGARARFDDVLFRRIEPPKIDLILAWRGGRTLRGFGRIACRDGLVL